MRRTILARKNNFLIFFTQKKDYFTVLLAAFREKEEDVGQDCLDAACVAYRGGFVGKGKCEVVRISKYQEPLTGKKAKPLPRFLLLVH